MVWYVGRGKDGLRGCVRGWGYRDWVYRGVSRTGVGFERGVGTEGRAYTGYARLSGGARLCCHRGFMERGIWVGLCGDSPVAPRSCPCV